MKPPVNEDDAPNEPVKCRRFDDCDFLDEDEPDEEGTSEIHVAAGANGLCRTIKGGVKCMAACFRGPTHGF